MSKGENIAKKQHYIPQVYLRGFSPEYLRKEMEKISYSRYTIYCYDLFRKTQIYKAVPIKSVCYLKSLYEVTGDKGEIVLPGYLEKCLSTVEKLFGEYRNKLERKAFIASNYQTNCFLELEEKNFWMTYILIQVMRSPRILEVARQVGLETWATGITDKQAQNLARIVCLPFFNGIFEEEKEMIVFNSLLEPMQNMSFGIGVDIEGRIVTSDMPVFIYSKEFPCDEYEQIIFPISSNLCLFMFGKEHKKMQRKNFLFPVNEYWREEIIKSISASALKNVYSNHILDKRERKYIQCIMQDRKAVVDIN